MPGSLSLSPAGHYQPPGAGTSGKQSHLHKPDGQVDKVVNRVTWSHLWIINKQANCPEMWQILYIKVYRS